MKRSAIIPLLSALLMLSDSANAADPLTLDSYLKRSEQLYSAALDVDQRQRQACAALYGLGEDTDPLAAEIAADVQTFLKAQETQRKAAALLDCNDEKETQNAK